MSSPVDSPLHLLALRWKESRPPQPLEISASRALLFETATREILFNLERNIPFDPLCDPRFKWAAQWLEVAEGTRRSIDPDVAFNFSLRMDPIPLSRKLLSAGSIE